MMDEFICLGALLGSVLLAALPIIVGGTFVLTLKWLIDKSAKES